MNECLELCGPQDIIILLGGPKGENKDSIATLGYRYLIRYVNMMNIIKNTEGDLPGSIIEGIIIGQTASAFDTYRIFLASTGKDVYNNSQFIKICRRGGFEEIPLNEIQFLAPFENE
jgi:hypothetical protein